MFKSTALPQAEVPPEAALLSFNARFMSKTIFEKELTETKETRRLSSMPNHTLSKNITLVKTRTVIQYIMTSQTNLPTLTQMTIIL